MVPLIPGQPLSTGAGEVAAAGAFPVAVGFVISIVYVGGGPVSTGAAPESLWWGGLPVSCVLLSTAIAGLFPRKK